MIEWRTTSGSTDLSTSDDFVAEWNGYGLRAEAMDMRRWWWAVTFPDGTRSDEVHDMPQGATTGKFARLMAEAVAVAHHAGSTIHTSRP